MAGGIFYAVNRAMATAAANVASKLLLHCQISPKMKFNTKGVRELIVLILVMLSEVKHLGFKHKKEILHCATLCFTVRSE